MLDSVAQPYAIQRLYDVVRSVNPERFDGVFVVRRHEHDQRAMVSCQTLRDR